MYLVKQGGGVICEMHEVEIENTVYDNEYRIINNDVVFATYTTQEKRDEEMRLLIVAIRCGQRLYQFSKDTQVE